MSLFQDDPFGISHERWVELARERNHDAFAILFEHHKVDLCRYIAFIVKNVEDAHDLTQIAFFKAWQGLPSLRDASRFKPWLYRIARNLAYDRVTHDARASFQSLESILAFMQSNIDPEEAVIQRELITLALTGLPTYLRECWLLQIAGFSLDEIAQTLGVSKRSASVYTSNARKQLRKGYLLLRDETHITEQNEKELTANSMIRKGKSDLGIRITEMTTASLPPALKDMEADVE